MRLSLRRWPKADLSILQHRSRGSKFREVDLSEFRRDVRNAIIFEEQPSGIGNSLSLLQQLGADIANLVNIGTRLMYAPLN